MNNNVAIAVSSFVLGGALGAFITKKLLKSKYERMAKEEIEEIREFYRNKLAEKEAEAKDEEQAKPDENVDTQEAKEEKEYGVGPYVISPDEFGELYDYDPTTLILYADGVLAYEDGVKVKEVDDIVGIESLNTFGKYEDDTVYVRNEAMKADYEIIRDEARYSDLFKTKSEQTE